MPKIGVSKLFTLTGHKDCIYALEKSGSSNLFFSAGGDGIVAVWDLKDPENGNMVAKVPASVYALHHYAIRDLLVVGQNFEGIHLIDWKARKEVASVKLTDAAIFDIKSYDDLLWVACGDGSLKVVNLESRQLLENIHPVKQSCRCLAINPVEREIAVGYSDYQIRIYDLRNGFRLKKSWVAHKNSVFTLGYSPDYRYLLSGSRDAHLKVWDAEQDYQPVESIVAHMYTINHLSYSADGLYFLTCSMDKTIKLWDAEKFRLLKVIDKARHAGHGTSVNKLLWTSFNNQIIACSDDRTISIWDLNFNEQA
jgi:WD40 repeat protein